MSALTKLIDFLGLTAQTEELVDAMDAKDADNLQAAKSYADTVAAAAGSSAAASSIPLSQKGTPGGVAELNSQGIVPSHQLPSFVDDVIEGYRLGQHFYSDAAHTTIVTDETGQSADQFSGKIYVDLGDNQTYRWAGSDYAVISESLALGTTEATAGRGDWTYTAYQHALAKGSQFASNLYKITTNTEGHVIAATPVTKQDIVDLGIPGSDTVYEDATTTTHGLMSASDKAKLDGVEAGAQVNPSDATTTAHGLMSAADKAKLDGIEANANNYTLPTMSTSTKGGAKVGHGLSVEGDALNLGPLTDSGSGASVQTDGCGIFGVTGKGWSEQDTTTGKNLAQPNTAYAVGSTIESYGITWTYLGNGMLKAHGTASGGTSMYASNSFVLGVLSGQHYSAIRLVSGTCSTFRNRIGKGSGSSYVGDSTNVGDIAVSSISSPDGTSVYYISPTIPSGTTAINAIFVCQCEAGSTATAYEPYTGGKASPNPDYPQEIRVARGRNLVDESTNTSGYYLQDNNGQPAQNANAQYTDYIAVEPGKRYVFSQVVGTDTNIRIHGYDDANTWKSRVGYYVTSSSMLSKPFYLIFDVPSDVTKIRASYGIASSSTQIEAGAIASPYMPFGNVGLEVQGKNLICGRINGYLAAANPTITVDNDTETFFFYAEQGKTYTRSASSHNRNTIAKVTDETSLAVTDMTALSSDTWTATWSGLTAWYFHSSKSEAVASSAQIEVGSVATSYVVPVTTTPIPLPAKGFAGALPDGTKDTLAIDSAGRVEWVNACDEKTFDGSESWVYQVPGSLYTTFSLPATYLRTQYVNNATGSQNESIISTHQLTPATIPASTAEDRKMQVFGIRSSLQDGGYKGFCFGKNNANQTLEEWKTWLASNPVTVLYPLAEQTTESTYIDLPALPAGATVSIPELEAIGVEWWVEGAEAIAEHGRDVSRANKEQEDRIAALEAKFASLGIEETIVATDGNVTVTYTNGLHVGYNKETFNMFTLPATPMGVSDKWIYNYDEHIS